MSPQRTIRPTKGKSADTTEPSVKVYRPINGHHCSLPIAENVLSMYLNDGVCVLMRRKFKQLFLICDKFSKTKLVFRSSQRIGLEKHRHLRYFYWTIHPYSKFRFYWEITMAITYLSIMIYTPLFGVNTQNPLTEKWSGSYYQLMNITCVFDIIINFFTGYLDKSNETVVLNLKQIFRHYILGYFLTDLLSTLPTDLMFPHIVGALPWYITLNRYLRIIRLPTALDYLENLFLVIRLGNQKSIMLVRIIILILLVEYVTYFTFVDKIWLFDGLELWDRINTVYMKLMYCTIRTLFLIQPHHHGSDPSSYFILIHQFVVLNCGNLFQAFLLARTMRIYNRTSMVLRKHEHLARQVKEYAKFKELPESMNRVLLQYVDFKFGRRIYNENLIISTLTPHMKDELFYIYSQDLVENVELFKDMPTSAIKRIACRLKQEILLPNDVIIQAGHEGSTMYFIIAGTVAVYTHNGKEVCHLTDGANFGEIALLMNETRTASIVAADFCELFKLNRKDFQEAIEPFPELKARMVQIAKERYTTILAFPSNEAND
ncbi:hypothetical protein WA026_000230 [Henosepilachna vigintioctopunctata]|uniref:Cyclic nucleotide-binding domain-containing protein n=1 Tax=Henosepilachna vigintioctopunctata TaxID=420089 RepID=A0AAW1V7F8_9CUCU